jgi:hypothetical protein
MLSTAWNSSTRWRSASVRSSDSTRSAGLLRNPIVVPFRPQNVHCDFAPHQQPRELSNGSLTYGR